MATLSNYVDKTKKGAEAPPTTTTAPEASKTLPHVEPYVVDYQGASIQQDDTWRLDHVPGSSERTGNTTPNYMQLRPSFGLNLHSKTCGLPVGANPQYYQPDI